MFAPANRNKSLLVSFIKIFVKQFLTLVIINLICFYLEKIGSNLFKLSLGL